MLNCHAFVVLQAVEKFIREAKAVATHLESMHTKLERYNGVQADKMMKSILGSPEPLLAKGKWQSISEVLGLI